MNYHVQMLEFFVLIKLKDAMIFMVNTLGQINQLVLISKRVIDKKESVGAKTWVFVLSLSPIL